MSDNAPTPTEPQSANGDAGQRPPLPAQPAHDAAANPAAPAGQAPYTVSGGAVPSPSYPASAHAPSGQPAPQHAPYVPPSAPASHVDPAASYPTLPYGTHGSAAAPSHPAAPAAPTGNSGPSGKVGAGKVVGIMVAAALVGGAAGLGAAAAGASFFPQSQTVVTTGPSTVTVNNPDAVNPITGIAAKVVPSVVTISASAGSSGGTGSGVVLTEDGYVVTNTHVVTLDGATADAKLTVTTSDGAVYAAEIVGTDPTYDLAVIKLTGASGLTPVEFADSAKLNVGDQTVAVGAPLGLANTVTTGIVSALNRSIEIASSAAPEGDSSEQSPEQGNGDSPFQFDFGQGQQQSATSSISIAVIQTDAAINPGNSGGALVDGQGKLIGINVAIASTGGSSASSQAGSIGVGFSIPSDIVQRVADEIIENGSATHGLLGAGVRSAAAQEGATTSGAYIAEVTSGGAAAAAGLKEGDVVTSFNGLPITDATDLTAQVRALAAGSTAELVYVRDGKTAAVEVTLGSLTD